MKIPRVLTVLFALVAGVALNWAQEPPKATPKGESAKTVDLTKIERKILSEPHEYVAKKQQYCLLVFGPEAKFRVWLVHDADILYVNRNGDGKLTEIEPILGNHSGHFKVGTLVEPSGKLKHTSLMVYFSKQGGFVTILIGGKFKQKARFLWSNKASDAPIVHLNGPVSVMLESVQEIVRGKPEEPHGIGLGPVDLLRRSRDAMLDSCWLGTPGLGSFAHYEPREVLPQGRLTLEVAFSKKGAAGPGACARGTMMPGLDHFSLMGYVRVPDNAPLGNVDLTFSFPENKDVRALPPVMRNIRISDK